MNEFLDALLNWVANGLADFSAWQLVVYTLVVTHITIAAVTIFLHRSQAHRALDLACEKLGNIVYKARAAASCAAGLQRAGQVYQPTR